MPSINVSRTIKIQSSATHIMSILSDFSQWRIWSPWLITEPEATLSIADDGRSYSWLGKRVGEGNMKLTHQHTSSSIDFELTFLKPWKSKAQVNFTLSEEGDHTHVIWNMRGSLPIFMFWMKKMMEAFVGMDYERGLRMLKDYAETGSVPSKLEFEGESSFDGCDFIGIKTSTTIDEIGAAMEQDFGKLMGVLQSRENIGPMYGLAIYHDYDVVKRNVEYTCGFAIENKTQATQLSDGIFLGNIPQLKVYKLVHTGPYMHLGNAWSATISCQRAKVFKSSKAHHPFELYLNDPTTTPENELLTAVCFAAK